MVTVRNKKRVGYSYEISLRFQGKWLINEGMKEIKGGLKIPEASYGDLEDMQAGTWEERNLSTWASNRIKELLNCLDTQELEFASGNAKILEVSSCIGESTP